jgi:transcriptional regulator with XRE-family HTH domain
MAIGQRIKFFRNRKGMTQKQLGEILGFLGKTSDVRMAQYESEARVPKLDLVKEMAGIFDVSTHALTVPDIDTYIGLMHTLFALEDMYGLKISEVDGEPCLHLDRSISVPGSQLDTMFHAWQQQSYKLANGEIGKDEYDEWRYKYPELDTYQHWAKVPSQEISDMLMEEFRKAEAEEKKEEKRKKKK